MKYNEMKTSAVAGKKEKTVEKRSSFRVIPPLSAVNEIAIWFKGFDVSAQISLDELGMPDIVSVSKEKRIVLEDLSGTGLRMSMDKKVLAMNGINRISDRITVYLTLCSQLKGKNEGRSVLVGMQLTGADSQENRVVIRGRILVQARPDQVNNKLTFYNVARAGVKEIHVLREEIARMPKNEMARLMKKVNMENLLIELLADDDTRSNSKR